MFKKIQIEKQEGPLFSQDSGKPTVGGRECRPESKRPFATHDTGTIK
jgi:hypothetical protein